MLLHFPTSLRTRFPQQLLLPQARSVASEGPTESICTPIDNNGRLKALMQLDDLPEVHASEPYQQVVPDAGLPQEPPPIPAQETEGIA